MQQIPVAGFRPTFAFVVSSEGGLERQRAGSREVLVRAIRKKLAKLGVLTKRSPKLRGSV